MLTLRPHWAVVAVALCIFAIACSSDSEGDACTGDGIVVAGIVKAFEPGVARQDFEYLTGVEVCVHGRDDIPCALSEGGLFELCDLPRADQLLLRFEHPDFLPMLRMLETGQADYDILAETVLGANDLAENQAAEFGVAVDAINGGAIQFFGAGPGDGVLQVRLLDGYSVELLTLEGDPAQCPDGMGGTIDCLPLYLDEDGEIDFDLTASTRVGIGAYGNVPPGKYLLAMSHPDYYCAEPLPESGFFVPDGGEVVEVEVLEGFITAQVGLFCQNPEL